MNRFTSQILAVLMLVSLMLPTTAPSADARVQRIQFKPGKTSTVVLGSVKGSQSMEYLVNARAGQTMVIMMTASNGSNYFNVFEPGKKPGRDEAAFIGSTSGNKYKAVLTESGDYLVQVYLMRNAARENKSSLFTVSVAITGTPSTAGTDVKVPGTNYNATGTIMASMGNGQPTTQCPFGVVRRERGTADVTVTRPNGRTRTFFFVKGKAIGCDQSQADWGGDFKAKKEADLWIIRVGRERYEIPEAVIYGG